MIEIISGSNRPGAQSLVIAKIVKDTIVQYRSDAQILNLRDVPLNLVDGSQYSDNHPKELRQYIDRVNHADGLVVVCPEYNGSMPGALKYFIDHWRYPISFEFRPVCFIGLGGRYGGLRPVEHLQHVFGYRNAFIYPERVFISNVWDQLRDGKLTHEPTLELVEKQLEGFCQFIGALRAAKLDANSRG